MGTEQKNSALNVRILGHDYLVACPESEREALLESAEYLSQRMATIQRHGKSRGIDRIAIMAALNITRDLLNLQHRIGRNEIELANGEKETNDRLAQLQLRIKSTLEASPEQEVSGQDYSENAMAKSRESANQP